MAAPETVLDKLPPQNLDAEMGVLGAMLLDREAIGHAIEAITADSFYKGAHAMIFSAVVELFDANEPVDIITLSEHLKKRKELEAVGGASYISALLDAVPSAANVSHHLKIVREKALLRRLIAAASGIVSRCYDGGEEVN